MTIILDGTTGITTPAINSSGDLELPGGTANGVLYLNGSKVATSGSALVFDGTNLGVGVTPSAWENFKGLQVGEVGAFVSGDFGGSNIQSFIGNNVYFESNFLYIKTNVASMYRIIGKEHQWSYAESGTAGDPITFTQAMTLDASGNLIVGTTTANAKIDCYVSITDGYRLTRGGSCTGTWTSDTDIQTIGTTTNHGFRFQTNNTERARITAGGDLLVGTTTSEARLQAKSTVDAATIIRGDGDNVGYYGTVILANSARGATTGYNLYDGYANGGLVFRVYGNGNVINTNNSYGQISDVKTKQDIVDAASQWDDIKAVRVRKFRFKDNPEGALQIGVVAQELEEVSPGLIEETTDRDLAGNDLGTTTKSVKYSVLYMKAIKALQEAMARIENLEAEVSALKGV